MNIYADIISLLLSILIHHSYEFTMDDSSKFRCNYCGANLSSYQSLSKHRRSFHPDQTKPGTLKCGLCDETPHNQVELCAHISEIHNVKAEVQEITFTSQHDFDEWKSSIESKGKFNFVRHRGTSTSKGGIETDYLYCNHSGDCKIPTITKRVPRHALKRNNSLERKKFYCTCFAVVKSDPASDLITVVFCDGHYGHDSNLAQMRLSDSARQKVIHYLLDGRDKDWILTNMRSKSYAMPLFIIMTYLARFHWFNCIILEISLTSDHISA